MKWVTRKGIKFDRTAGVWLILRFIDPDAEFDFLTGDEMPAALAAGAQPFHNYAWTGNPADLPAERLNLPGLIAKYGLAEREPALTLFAESVQKAERAGWAKPGYENEGLWAIANGLWLLSDQNDATFAQRMLPMYDALFAYCQMRVAGGRGWQGDS